MQQLHDVVRMKVDEMRAGGGAQAPARPEVMAALARLAAEQPHDPAQGGRGALHMCPWHTCQATRHG